MPGDRRRDVSPSDRAAGPGRAVARRAVVDEEVASGVQLPDVDDHVRDRRLGRSDGRAIRFERLGSAPRSGRVSGDRTAGRARSAACARCGGRSPRQPGRIPGGSAPAASLRRATPWQLAHVCRKSSWPASVTAWSRTGAAPAVRAVSRPAGRTAPAGVGAAREQRRGCERENAERQQSSEASQRDHVRADCVARMAPPAGPTARTLQGRRKAAAAPSRLRSRAGSSRSTGRIRRMDCLTLFRGHAYNPRSGGDRGHGICSRAPAPSKDRGP